MLAKFKKMPSGKKVQTVIVGLFLVFVALLVLSSGIELFRYRTLAAYPNQACVGVGMAAKAGFELKPYEIDAHSIVESAFGFGIGEPKGNKGRIGQHVCKTGRVITEQITNPDGSGSSSGYELGANVIYFNSNGAAQDFAKLSANPSRNWSVNDVDAAGGIPQTSSFTYLVTDVKEPYFDAYTLRGQAIVYLNLPCRITSDAADADRSKDFDTCNKDAQKVLKAFADKVGRTIADKPVF